MLIIEYLAFHIHSSKNNRIKSVEGSTPLSHNSNGKAAAAISDVTDIVILISYLVSVIKVIL